VKVKETALMQEVSGGEEVLDRLANKLGLIEEERDRAIDVEVRLTLTLIDVEVRLTLTLIDVEVRPSEPRLCNSTHVFVDLFIGTK